MEWSLLYIAMNALMIVVIIRDKSFHLFLKLLICVSYFGWNAIPLILSFFSRYESAIKINIDIYRYYANVNQLFFFFTLFFAYLFVKYLRYPKLFVKRDFQYSPTFLLRLYQVSIIILIIRIITLAFSNISYLEGNNIESISEKHSLGMLQMLYDFAIYILLAECLFYGNFLGKKRFNYVLILLSAYFLLLTFNGGRIYIFALVIVFVYFALKTNKKKYFFAVVCLSTIAFMSLSGLAALRGQDRIKGIELYDNFKDATLYGVFDELFTKTNSVAYSCYLIIHDGIGNVGSQLYTSTFYALIPRVFYPKKPQPGSVDGTLYGTPARLSAAYDPDIKSDYNDISNNGVSTSLEALWAMGWSMFLLQIVVCSLFIFFLNAVLIGRKPLFVYFFLSLIGFPVCILDVSLVKLLMGVQRFFIIYVFFLFFCGKRNSTGSITRWT